jgi:hypothetical protein
MKKVSYLLGAGLLFFLVLILVFFVFVQTNRVPSEGSDNAFWYTVTGMIALTGLLFTIIFFLSPDRKICLL